MSLLYYQGLRRGYGKDEQRGCGGGERNTMEKGGEVNGAGVWLSSNLPGMGQEQGERQQEIY